MVTLMMMRELVLPILRIVPEADVDVKGALVRHWATARDGHAAQKYW
jgi:hypothetical protein